MQKQIKKYTIYACLIISFATYSFSLKEFNSIIVQAEEVTNGFNRRMINKAQAQEPQEAVDEVLKVKETIYNHENSESRVVKAKPLTEIQETIKDVFGSDWKIALAVATAESTLDPTVIGDKHIQEPSYGLFQINTYWNPKYDPEKLLEVRYNCEAGLELSTTGRGWRNWTTFREETYLEHLIK